MNLANISVRHLRPWPGVLSGLSSDQRYCQEPRAASIPVEAEISSRYDVGCAMAPCAGATATGQALTEDPMRLRHAFLAALAACLLVIAGCQTATEHVRIAHYTKYQRPEAGHTAEQDALVNRLCLFGEPTHAPAWPHGPTTEIIRPGYVLENSATDKDPLWVCEHLGEENIGGPLKRPKHEPFAPDPLLVPPHRAELSDYRNSGYDRGHQAPSGDETKDLNRQCDTYYLSNMAPQVGQFNQHSWKNLEDLVRGWAAACGGAYIITGPLFYDPKEDDAKTATGYFKYKTVGRDQVAVPTHLFKIIVLKDKGGQWRSLAFVMENKTYPAQVNYKDYIRSIRWIEDRSGFRFLPGLDKPGNEALRQQLKGQAPADIWPAAGPQ